MQTITKKEFKQLHAAGSLTLLGAASLTKEAVADVVNAAIKLNKLPAGDPTGGLGNIDDRHHKVYRDGGVIYLERIEQGDDWRRSCSDRPLPLTVAYRVK